MWPFHASRAEGIKRDECWKLETRPAVCYTNLLFLDLAEDLGREWLLRRSQPLPVPAAGTSPADLPDFAHVVNRLKILCGLDPVNYPRPVEGTIKLRVGAADVVVQARFNDVEGEVRLRMEPKP